MSIQLDYLFLAAHPDDAELFCGGTIIKMRQKGYNVGICDLTRGEAGTSGTVADRECETAAAEKILQTTWRGNLGLPDSALEDNLQARIALVNVIREYRAKILIAPMGPCRHPDHTAVCNLARSAYFYAGAGQFPSEFPKWRPYRVLYHLEHQDIQPSFMIDISEQFNDKMRAVDCYATQFYTAEHGARKTVIGTKQFRDRIITRAAYFGTQIQCEYAEPYIIDTVPRIDDPLKTLLEG